MRKPFGDRSSPSATQRTNRRIISGSVYNVNIVVSASTLYLKTSVRQSLIVRQHTVRRAESTGLTCSTSVDYARAPSDFIEDYIKGRFRVPPNMQHLLTYIRT